MLIPAGSWPAGWGGGVPIARKLPASQFFFTYTVKFGAYRGPPPLCSTFIPNQGLGVYSEFTQNEFAHVPLSGSVRVWCTCSHAYSYNTNDRLQGGRIHRAIAPGFKPVRPEAPSNIQYPIVVSKGNTVTTSWIFKP